MTPSIFDGPAADAPLTMSSREIAELVDSRHDDVKRSIERLAERGAITLPPLAEVSNQGPGPKIVSVYMVGKRDSYVIVAQLSPEFTARLVDRWQELEAQQVPAIPRSFAEALRLAAAQAEQIEAQQAVIEQQKPAVEFLGRYVEARSSKGLREVAKVLGIPERKFIARLESDGILFRQGSNLLPYAQHQHAGYFEVKTGETNGHAYHQTRFTPAGVAWIAKRMSLQQGQTAVVAHRLPASNDSHVGAAQKPI